MSAGRGESLASRVAATTARRRPAGEQPAVPPATRHCWYGGPHGRQAALLLGWRRVGGGYDGRIAVAAPDADGWALVEMWVDAGLLAPADAVTDGAAVSDDRVRPRRPAITDTMSS